MVRQIKWQEPDETTVTSVEIYKSTDKYGTYSLLDTIDATSDGAAKSSSNTWVTSYTDSTGDTDDWYKIRFYDGTYYSDYSDPISAQEHTFLCSIKDVKKYIDTTGRWADDELYEAIIFIEGQIREEMGKPVKDTVSQCVYDRHNNNEVLRTYYVGEENIYRIDRLFYGTVTKTEAYYQDQFKLNTELGLIKFLPTASGGPTLTIDMEIRMQYIPKIYNRICALRVAEHLLSKTDIMNGGEPSSELEVIQQKLQQAEMTLNHELTPILCSDLINYDPKYEKNSTEIDQDVDYIHMIGTNAW